MKDQAARVCRALCRTRVVAEMHQRRGTRLADHLRLVLSIMDRAGRRRRPQVRSKFRHLHRPSSLRRRKCETPTWKPVVNVLRQRHVVCVCTCLRSLAMRYMGVFVILTSLVLLTKSATAQRPKPGRL